MTPELVCASSIDYIMQETPPDETAFSPTLSDYNEAKEKYNTYKQIYYTLLDLDEKLASLKIDLDSASNYLLEARSTTTNIFSSLYNIKTTMTDAEMNELEDIFKRISQVQNEIDTNTIEKVDTKISKVDKNREKIHELLMKEAHNIREGYFEIENLSNYKENKYNELTDEYEEKTYYTYRVNRYNAIIPSSASENES